MVGAEDGLSPVFHPGHGTFCDASTIGGRRDARAGSIGESLMEFRLLGTVTIRHHGRIVPIGASMPRSVLAALLLNANRIVSVDWLTEVLWGDRPPPTAIPSLHNHVRRLRILLGEHDRARLRAVSPGYLIQVEDEELDLRVFTKLARAGQEAYQAGDWETAAEKLAAALRVWNGDPLADVASQTLRESEVPRLTEVRLHTLETRIDADVRRGQAAEVISELTGLITAHPLRERLYALLMGAYYRTGRQAEALATYQRARDRLVEDLGIEPGPALARLQQRILAGDLDGPAAPPSASPPDRPVRPTQLPSDLADFTGRHDQLKAVEEVLAAAERRTSAVVVSSVTGSGGVGKTSLAVHAGHRCRELFPDGQLWFGMRGTDAGPADPAEVLARFLRDLGVDPGDIPVELDERAARFRSVVAGRRLLIVLDDVRDAAQVRPLLPGTSGCAVLVTSRRPLTDLPGARQVVLDSLPAEQAARLLAGIVGPDRVAAEPAAAMAVVELCAGLPLALRIAGARLAARPHWRLSDLVDRLSDAGSRLDELVVGDLSVRASFSVSYAALPTVVGPGAIDPARAFRLLGLWSGPDISAPAAAALFGVSDRAAEQVLETLLDSHLLQPGWSARRYRLHDLLRVYAGELAREVEPRAHRKAAVRRLISWYLQTAYAAARVLEPQIQQVPPATGDLLIRPLTFPTYEQALQWCETERTDLVAAIRQAAQCGQHALAWQLPITLRRFFRLGKHWTDWIDTFTTALASARVLGERQGEGLILYSLAEPYLDLGRMDEAIGCLREALSIHREMGDRRAEARTLGNLGVTAGMLGRFEESAELLYQALSVHRDIGNRYNEAICLENIAEALRGLRRFEEAIGLLRQALAIHDEIGDRYNNGSALTALGDVYRDIGSASMAVDCYERALPIRRSLGDRGGEAGVRIGLGQALHDLGRVGEARAAWEAAHSILTDLGDPRAADVEARLLRR